MAKRRNNYTYPEAQTILKDWLSKNRMNETQFQRWLDLRGVMVSRQYIHLMMAGQLTPGPKFKQVFREITGIGLIDGLIED